jgi:hypothetical protein
MSRRPTGILSIDPQEENVANCSQHNSLVDAVSPLIEYLLAVRNMLLDRL